MTALGNLALVGVLTDKIEEFARGDIERDELVEFLVGFDYGVPARYAEMPEDLFEAEDQAEDRTYEDEGTMDEVKAAVDRGLLDAEVLYEVAEAREAAAG